MDRGKESSAIEKVPVPRVPGADPLVQPWRDPGWQRLWLALLAKPWSSLALVPASSGAPNDFALDVAVTLARTAIAHLREPIQVADGTQVQMTHLTSFSSELQSCKDSGYRVLVALAPVSESPVTVALSQSTDFALLCVLFGKMATADAKRTIAEIGHGRFIGSATFHPDKAEGREQRRNKK
jgi:hypothetical protein